MIVPIVGGIPQYHAINRLELGGRDITKQLEEIIEKNSNNTFIIEIFDIYLHFPFKIFPCDY